jgi:Raf kinase inhibitor-like YbhB/YbcL family protein
MLALTSTAFRHEAAIPARHTCQGEDLSPPLAWSDPPPGTKSFALIVDDPDAPDPAKPRLTWVHWLLYGLEPTRRSLDEGAGNATRAPEGEHALTHADSLGYHGPCPPIGRHRYFFRLVALDARLPSLGPDARRADLERAMAGHILGTAVLMGTYAK